MPFISFSYLIAMAGTSSILLNSRDRSRHHCLVSDFTERLFSLSQLSLMLSVGFLLMHFFSQKVVIEFVDLIGFRCNFFQWGQH